jgi:hypothetical protein
MLFLGDNLILGKETKNLYSEKEYTRMNQPIIHLLETIKMQSTVKYTDFLEDNEIDEIYKWYENFSNQDGRDLEKIIDLMYFFYTHESIEFYPVEYFQKIYIRICEEYALKKNIFLKCNKVFVSLFTAHRCMNYEHE